MNNNETIIFELCQTTHSSYKEANGQPRRAERPFGIPAQTTIIDDDGDVREIRYVKSQKEVFVDEQRIDPSKRITRLVSKPQFTAGMLVVKANQKNLLEFLRLHPLNETNAHRRTNGERSVFRERNPVEMAKKDNISKKAQINATRLVWESDFLSKIVPVANYLKIDTSRDSDLILWDVQQYAEKNSQDFIDLLDNQVVSRHSEIFRAIKMGVIRLDGQRLLWSDGRQIIETPTNYDVLEYFAEVSFDDKYRTVYAEIERLMNKVGGKGGDEKALLKGGTSKDEDMSNLDAEELIEQLKEAKVIVWKIPHFTVNGQPVAKKKEDLIEYVKENKRLLIAQM
tara:strand:+ start:1126 stop:2145 length:1020 start_codon:yes stop_codon:yes gene_type:complete